MIEFRKIKDPYKHIDVIVTKAMQVKLPHGHYETWQEIKVGRKIYDVNIFTGEKYGLSEEEDNLRVCIYPTAPDPHHNGLRITKVDDDFCSFNMVEYISSDSKVSCSDSCIHGAGYNCRLCRNFKDTLYYKELVSDSAVIEWREEVHGDDLNCSCGNQTHLDGFYPCLPNGVEIDPILGSPWTDLYICGKCGQVFKWISTGGTHEKN